MKRKAALALMGALVLSGCQTTGSGAGYVKVRPGPELEVARAECRARSEKVSHVVIGIGGPEVIAGALIGTAIATSLRRAQYFEYCMAALGYQKVDPRAAPQPAPTPAVAVPATKPGKTPAKKAPSKKAAPAKAPARAG